MRTLITSVILGGMLAVGSGISAQAADRFGPPPNPASMVQRWPGPSFDPYTGGASVCVQGTPTGGPKCAKIIPDSELNR